MSEEPNETANESVLNCLIVTATAICWPWLVVICWNHNLRTNSASSYCGRPV